MLKINTIYKKRFIKKNLKKDGRYYFLFKNKYYKNKFPFHYRIDKGNHMLAYCLYRKRGSLIATYFPPECDIINVSNK